MRHCPATTAFLLLTFAAACRSEQESTVAETRDAAWQEAIEGQQSTTEKVGNTGRGHAYVRRFYEQKGRYYATLDYVQFLKGADAVAAAQRRGDAAMDVRNGDTIYSVFNDYYIVNENRRQRTLPLSPNAGFRLWNKQADLRQYTASPAEVLTKGTEVFRYAPFIVETRQGEITSLTEQYIP